jgi:hypothetical protein
MPSDQVPEINFKAEELQASYKISPIVEWINKVGVNILIGVQAIILVLLAANFFLSRGLTSLTNEYDSLKARIDAPEEQALLKDYEKLQKQVIEIENIEKAKVNWPERLKFLGDKVPSDLLIENFSFGEESLRVDGRVRSVQGFALFITKIRNDPAVTSIILEESVYDKEAKEFSFALGIGL